MSDPKSAANARRYRERWHNTRGNFTSHASVPDDIVVREGDGSPCFHVWPSPGLPTSTVGRGSMSNMATPFFKDGRAYPTERQLDDAMGELAEFLSRGFEIAEASDRMGLSRGSGCVIFKRLCERMGPQAV